MISQLKPNYLHLLNTYNKTLEQRNTYLKQIKFDNKTENMLEIWDERLAELSYQIYKYRTEYIHKIQEIIGDIHNLITNCGQAQEKIEINFISSGKSKNEFYEKLEKSRKLDIQKGFTSTGIHRDDFEVFIDNKKVNIYGSQGQQRTTALSAKLAEIDLIEQQTAQKPILLLDDVFSELDRNRQNFLMENIGHLQTILTCTGIEDVIKEYVKQAYLFYVEKGEIKRIK